MKIKAEIPTGYQLNTLRSFGMDIKQHLDGSFSAEMEFADEDDAKRYLLSRLTNYYYMSDMSYDDFASMTEKIEKDGMLTIDGVTASMEIEKKDE